MQIQETTTVTTSSSRRGPQRFEVDASAAEIQAIAQFTATFVALGKKVRAIKHVRSMLGCGLLEAVTFVEDADETYNLP